MQAKEIRMEPTQKDSIVINLVEEIAFNRTECKSMINFVVIAIVLLFLTLVTQFYSLPALQAEFDLEKERSGLDEQGLKIAENQDNSQKNRRKLAESTRGTAILYITNY